MTKAIAHGTKAPSVSKEEELAQSIVIDWGDLPDQPIRYSMRSLIAYMFADIEALIERGYSLRNIHELICQKGVNLNQQTFERYYRSLKNGEAGAIASGASGTSNLSDASDLSDVLELTIQPTRPVMSPPVDKTEKSHRKNCSSKSNETQAQPHPARTSTKNASGKSSPSNQDQEANQSNQDQEADQDQEAEPGVQKVVPSDRQITSEDLFRPLTDDDYRKRGFTVSVRPK